MTPRLDAWTNERTETVHACNTMGPRTLCGKPMEGNGWKRIDDVRFADESVVTCNRCRKVIWSLMRTYRE